MPVHEPIDVNMSKLVRRAEPADFGNNRMAGILVRGSTSDEAIARVPVVTAEYRTGTACRLPLPNTSATCSCRP